MFEFRAMLEVELVMELRAGVGDSVLMVEASVGGGVGIGDGG